MVSSGHTQVEKAGEISLGRHRFKTIGGVRSDMASIYPGKVVIGDITKDSQARASVLALSYWGAGIGRYRSEEAATVDRAWWSNLNLRHRNNLVLGPLATGTTGGPADDVGVIFEFGDEVYAAFGTSLRKYDNSAGTWGSELHSLPAVATDAVVARLDGTVVAFIAHTDGYSYSTDGTSWTDGTDDIKYLAWWDDKIWGIDNTGQLRNATWVVAEDWADDAQLPLPDGSVTDLFEGKNAAGNSILYAMTTYGLYAHDFDNNQFRQTQLTLPRNANNGTGSRRWRDALYIPVGNAVYRYQDGTATAVISLVGPDRDDGMPSEYRGNVVQLEASHNQLIALVDGSAESGGFSTILGWDELGWQVLWTATVADEAVCCAKVVSAYSGTYRLWWAWNKGVYFMDLPTHIINPDQVTTQEYASIGVLDTPWFNMGQDDVNKLALTIDMTVSKVTETETIQLSYGLDLSETLTSLVIVDAQPNDGHVVIELPSDTLPEGIAFRWIRFRLNLARGTTTNLTPHVHNLTLTFRKKLPYKEAFSFTIDMGEAYGGLNPREQRAKIREFAAQDELLEFVYRSDSVYGPEFRRYFVDVINKSDTEFSTGLEEGGQVRLVVAEI